MIFFSFLTERFAVDSSQLYQKFDRVMLLSHGRALYSGPGGFAPSDYFSSVAPGMVPSYQQGYNVAEYLLEVANDPPLNLFQLRPATPNSAESRVVHVQELQGGVSREGLLEQDSSQSPEISEKPSSVPEHSGQHRPYASRIGKARQSATFLTQLQYLSGREWKILKRDKTLFLTHVAVASVLGVFCGMYYFLLYLISIYLYFCLKGDCILTQALPSLVSNPVLGVYFFWYVFCLEWYSAVIYNVLFRELL